MSIESGLKLLLSAERGVSSDGQRTLGPKTKELFRAVGTHDVLSTMVEAFKNKEELPAEKLQMANSMVTTEMILLMKDYYSDFYQNEDPGVM
ncbi:MAG TPA: hypothetical protein VJ227_00470 [Patescibacteria group bacterium]|nr:hypothetical protein [Patescibacteria group bacterium]